MNPAGVRAVSSDADTAQLRGERDLYLRLLELGRQEHVEPFLREALGLIVELVNAERGYIALGHLGDDLTKAHRWSLAHCCTEEQVADIRAKISHSIIAEAVATGQTIHTPSAVLDPAFSQNQSVRLNRIEAVLCAPVGQPLSVGVIYLQGHVGGGAFPDEAQRNVELFATHLAPLANRVVAKRSEEDSSDRTRTLREHLVVEGLIGRSEVLADLLHEIKVVAPKKINVMITGESGTEKAEVARAIHDNSPRARTGRFVTINCADLDEQVFRNTLFGASGADIANDGAPLAEGGLSIAPDGGTLFLDEISELSMASQGVLLQFLQHGEFVAAGPREVGLADVRLVCATHVDLQAAMHARRFREDLYYRLVGMPIRVPSLGERPEDVPLLLEYYCRRACETHAVHIVPSANAYHAVDVAEWRGNVRQLALVVERAVIRADADGAGNVEPRHLFPELETAKSDDPIHCSFQDATRAFQRRYLERLLRDTQWNVTETARRANLARTYLHKLINVYGLQRPD